MIDDPDKLSEEAVEAWVKANANKTIQIPDDAYYVFPPSRKGQPSRARGDTLILHSTYRPMNSFGEQGILHAIFWDHHRGQRRQKVRGAYCRWQAMDAALRAGGSFPHKCPRCGAPAYIGFKDVDCSAKCGFVKP